MSDNSEHDPTGGAARAARHEGWSDADIELERRQIRDEIRIARDEERVEADERWIRRNWRLELVLGALMLLTIAALVLSAMALNRDIDKVAASAPRDDSVGTSVLRDGAVSSAKLADGAVIARTVTKNSLTGVQIDETTLISVPRAARAARADKADRAATADRATRAATAADASALAGVAGGRYVSRLSTVSAQTQTSTLAFKGPVSVTCPAGTTVVGGGASIDGAARVAITTSTPDGSRSWTAEAAALGDVSAPWRIVVTAVCVRGG